MQLEEKQLPKPLLKPVLRLVEAFVAEAECSIAEEEWEEEVECSKEEEVEGLEVPVEVEALLEEVQVEALGVLLLPQTR